MLSPSPSRLCLAFAAACLTGVGTASAAIDLPSLLARTDTATRVDVYLVPPMMLYRLALDEAQMQDQACRYASSNPAAVRALAALFTAADVTASVVYQRPDMREGAYFRLADGTRVGFLLQDNYGGHAPVTGLAETTIGDDLQTVSVTAKETLATDLRAWATVHGGAGIGPRCDRPATVPASLPPLPQ